jgi:NAD(P)-dependent dehydrogenase (short-subunit alcohol dehydrogenase family)
MLIAAGARVTVLDLDSPHAERAASELGEAARFVPGDVCSEEDVLAALAAGEVPPSIVVNCAGISRAHRVAGRSGPFPIADFSRVIEINLIGTFNVIRLAAAALSATEEAGEERGVFVNTASVAAFDGQIGQAAYAASKAGVAGMTLPIARDLAQYRIRVVTIAPGLFLTPMFESLPQESIDSLGASTPHPARLGRPEEYAALVQSIVANPMLNGETIRLDGAVRLAPR